jgi:hypothetical protein
VDRTTGQNEHYRGYRVLWRYKLLILSGMTIGALAVGLFTLTRPEMYRANMIIRTGAPIYFRYAKKIQFDSPINIKAIIEQGALNEAVNKFMKDNQYPIPKETLNYKIVIPSGTNILRITHEAQNAETGKMVLDALAKALSNYYAAKRALYLGELDDSLRSLRGEVDLLNAEQAAVQRRVNIIQSLIAQAEQNSEPENKKQTVSAAGKLLEPDMQLILLTKLLDEAESDRMRLRDEKKRVINNMTVIEKSRDDFRFIEILKAPKSARISRSPILRNRLVVTLIISFFLMTLLSFSHAYFKKSPNRESKMV